MSLTSSLGMAANTINVNNIALQVVGQNLANANTPGYIRERVVLAAAPTQKYGGVMMGMGVMAKGVQQVIDMFLEQRLRSSTSDLVNSETQEQCYTELEALVNELTDNDLSTSMDRFFNSISNVLNQPESVSNRNLVALQGERFARDANRLGDQIFQMQTDINQRVEEIADEINNLTLEIEDLNLQIANAEGGDVSASDAVGLRDQRLTALTKLAELIDIRVEEQETSGAVAVYCGSNFLVFEGERREVEVTYDTEGDFPRAEVRLVKTQGLLDCRAGELYGQYICRDEILSSFSDQLDDFIKTTIFEFNKLHTSGQGLSGYTEVTSETAVTDTTLPLDSEDLALPYTPVNGSFEIIVRNTDTGLDETTRIFVEMDQPDPDDHDSLDDLVAKINAVSGVTATATLNGKLNIQSDAANLEFAFGDDSSHILAVLGINTFFTGSTARDMAVSETVMNDPAKFAASKNGIALDTENAIDMAALPDMALEGHNDESLITIYKRLANSTAEGSAIAKEQANADRVYQGTLNSQKLATSGVNIDEESIKLMVYQRAYQANAKYISTISELLDVLIQL